MTSTMHQTKQQTTLKINVLYKIRLENGLNQFMQTIFILFNKLQYMLIYATIQGNIVT